MSDPKTTPPVASALTNIVKAGRLIRLLGWVSLVFGIGVGAAVLIPSIHDSDLSLLDLVPLVLLIALSLAYLFVGASVKKSRPWAKVVGAVLAGIGLLNFPIGTFIGVFILYYLAKGWNEASQMA